MADSEVGLRDGGLGLRPGRRRSMANNEVGLRDGGRWGLDVVGRVAWGLDVVGRVAWNLDLRRRKDGVRPRLRGVGAWATSVRLAFQVGGASPEK